jgi:hypothetical protein
MRKLAGLGLIAIAALGLGVWAKSAAFSGQTNSDSIEVPTISPHELHIRTDVNALPVLETGDLI